MHTPTPHPKGGRPQSPAEERRDAVIRLRCRSADKIQLIQLAKTAGLTLTEYLLRRGLDKAVGVNYAGLHRELHAIGTEFARSGNNLNQLAKHANTLKLAGRIDPSVATRLTVLLDTYVQREQELRRVLRRIIREMVRP